MLAIAAGVEPSSAGKPAVDKSVYHLFNPTPTEHLRAMDRGVLFIARDVTEREQRLESALKSEVRLTATLEAAIDAIITMDHEGRIHEWNPAAERMFGYARSEVIGKVLEALIIPAYAFSVYRLQSSNHDRCGMREADKRDVFFALSWLSGGCLSSVGSGPSNSLAINHLGCNNPRLMLKKQRATISACRQKTAFEEQLLGGTD